MEVHRIESMKAMVNGRLVADAMVGTHYDSNKQKIEIDTYNKGKRDHIELDNKDIMKIMSKPASAMSLEKRLMRDFSSTKSMKKRGKKRGKKRMKKRKSIKK